MFDSEKAYAQVTHPLRELTKKGAHFKWSEECEAACKEILKLMTPETALRPFDPKLKTNMITDAGPMGIAASIFQEEQDGTWVPIDHASRSLTPCEQGYAQIEKESLAQSWGMNMHRYYLLGISFDTYTDHQPLVPIYSTSKKQGPIRVEKYRLKVQNFQYNIKYIPGKKNPCDYASRHPVPLANYSEDEIDNMIIDHGDEYCINKIITDDLPDAVTAEMIREATAKDPTCQKLIACIKKGHITEDDDLKPYRQVFHELTHFKGVFSGAPDC